jgi:uncharacterized repeat protein (TIGR01451 family)
MILALALLVPSAVFAATAPGVSVSNQATVDYEVSGLSQPTLTTASISFTVDRKVGVTVAWADAANVAVVSNEQNAALKFTVTNDSNEAVDIAVSAIQNAVDFSVIINGVFLDDGDGVWEGSAIDLPITYIDELGAGLSNTVWAVGNIPASATNTQIGSLHLLATIYNGNDPGTLNLADTYTQTAGANTVGIDTVFADSAGTEGTDGNRDAEHSDAGNFVVSAAALTIGKTSTIISDPFNGGTNPKAIPGAVIEYKITVSNGAGSSPATNITITDSLDTAITSGYLTFNTGTLIVNAPNINGGADLTLTDAVGGWDDEGEFNISQANTVIVNGINLNAGLSGWVRFRVTLQ